MRKLKHPLRYYLHQMWLDVGGTKVPYTPADEHKWEVWFDGRKVMDLRVIGGYAIIGKPGMELRDVSHRYAGETA